MIRIADTHSLIWYLNKDKRLSEPARIALSDANAQINIPTLVMAEIHHLHGGGRIAVSLADVEEYIAKTINVAVHPLTPDVARRVSSVLDIHDGIIVATALLLKETTGQDMEMVTRDGKITASALVQTVW